MGLVAATCGRDTISLDNCGTCSDHCKRPGGGFELVKDPQIAAPTPYAQAQEHSPGIASDATANNVYPLSPRDQANDDENCGQSAVVQDPNQAQNIVAEFVGNIRRGMEVEVLSTSGNSAMCVVALDRQLTKMTLQRAGKKDGKKREVPLENIDTIAVGTDLPEEVELPVDEFCATFFLLNNDGVLSYRFADMDQRDTFALCIAMFVEGRKKEVARRLEKAADKKAAGSKRR